MTRIETHSCDVCGVLKPANGTVPVEPWWTIQADLILTLVAYIDGVQYSDKDKTVCGKDCAAKFIMRWMAGRQERL